MVLAFSTPASGDDLVGTPRVVDGDTLEVDGARVRLLGIDAPERGEPGAVEATSALLNIIAGRDVTCTDTGGRTHGRIVATCTVGRGADLSRSWWATAGRQLARGSRPPMSATRRPRGHDASGSGGGERCTCGKATACSANDAGEGREGSFAEKAMKMSAAGRFEAIQGWFSETLRGFKPPEPIAVLRLDGDWYESTMVCLDALYPHVVDGGLILIDDYYTWDGCARAVHDYLSKHKLIERIERFEGACFMVKRPSNPA
jgi:hypothetical protein